MAKIYGINGYASGKLGNSVLAVYNGTQVVRQYQPVVSNPKSLGQKMQRAKANLIGQLSKITPWQILTGLGTNKRARRARFLRLGLLNATATVSPSDPSIINAKLADSDLIFSEGDVTPTMYVTAVTASARAIDVVVDKLTGITNETLVSSGCIVIAVLITTDGRYESVFYEFVQGEDVVSNSITINFPHISEGAYYVDVYIAPFSTIDGSSLRARSEQLFGSATDFAANMVYNPAALALRWGNSNLVSSGSYTPTAKKSNK